MLVAAKHKPVVMIEGDKTKKNIIFEEKIVDDQKFKDLMTENPDEYKTNPLEVQLGYENLTMN